MMLSRKITSKNLANMVNKVSSVSDGIWTLINNKLQFNLPAFQSFNENPCSRFYYGFYFENLGAFIRGVVLDKGPDVYSSVPAKEQ